MPCTPPPGALPTSTDTPSGSACVHGLSRSVGPAKRANSVVAADADVAADQIGVVLGHLGGGYAPDRHHDVAEPGREPLEQCRSPFRSWSTGEPAGTCAYVHSGRRPCASMRLGSARCGRRREDHRPFRRAGPRRPPLGERHLRAGAAHVQRRRLGQPLVAPRNLAGQHEVDFATPRAESIAPQRLCISRRQRVAVDVAAARSGRCRRAPRPAGGGVPARRAPVRHRERASRRSVRRGSPGCRRPVPASPRCAPSVASISPRAGGHQRRHRRNRMCGNASEQRAGVLAAQQRPTPACPARAAADPPAPRRPDRRESSVCRRGRSLSTRVDGCRRADPAGGATTRRRSSSAQVRSRSW